MYSQIVSGKPLRPRGRTDQERAGIKAQVIALCEGVEAGLLKDFEIAKGIVAFEDEDLAGRPWKFTLEGHLRTEDQPRPE